MSGPVIRRAGRGGILQIFREFARHADGCLRGRFLENLEAFDQPVGRLEIDAGFLAGDGAFQFVAAASLLHRQKSAEIKCVAGQPGAEPGP